jgi:hypothetical protein
MILPRGPCVRVRKGKFRPLWGVCGEKLPGGREVSAAAHVRKLTESAVAALLPLVTN